MLRSSFEGSNHPQRESVLETLLELELEIPDLTYQFEGKGIMDDDVD